MPEPTATLEEEVRVDHGMFALIDPDAAYWVGEPDAGAGHLVTVNPHRAWFHSAGTDHHAPVRVELWPAPPPPPGGWEARESASLTLTGRRLCLATTVDGPVVNLPGHGGADPWIRYLPLPGPGRYHLDVLVNGRTAAAALPEANRQHGVESWRIRLWPA